MAFNYTPKTWKNGPTGGTPITADELIRIDTGVKLAGDIADTAVTPDQLATAQGLTPETHYIVRRY